MNNKIDTKNKIQAFDDITKDGRLWAVRYKGDTDNILDIVFILWDDVRWLRSFFKENLADLQNYFNISGVDTTAENSFVDYLAEME